jgi:repressor LexA
MKQRAQPTPSRRTALTAKQAALLRFLASHFIAHQRFPTVREIMDETGLASTNGVWLHLQALIRKGYVSRSPEHKSRAYSIVGLSVAIRDAVNGHVEALLDQAVSEK